MIWAIAIVLGLLLAGLAWFIWGRAHFLTIVPAPGAPPIMREIRAHRDAEGNLSWSPIVKQPLVLDPTMTVTR
jgi:hypothetical protein